LVLFQIILVVYIIYEKKRHLELCVQLLVSSPSLTFLIGFVEYTLLSKKCITVLFVVSS
jgi:hypothetical protein